MKMVLKANELTFDEWPGEMLRFVDFTGASSRFNTNGTRTFQVELTKEYAEMLADAGWRVRAKEVHDDIVYTMKVNVNFKSKFPPTIYRIPDGNPKKKRTLVADSLNPQDDVSRLDNDARKRSILSADLVINGWRNPDDGKVTAFLSFGAFVVAENSIINKWADFDAEDDNGEVPW